MFDAFEYETIALGSIKLDPQNPRLVTLTPLTTEAAIIEYLFDHEELAEFLKKFAAEGKNLGAERPYVVKSGSSYTVIEGNTRIAAYKLLTGLASPSQKHKGLVPVVSDATKKQLLSVDCTVAPKREDLLPIMASAHFGLGDKSKWGYLGSRKAVYDEWTKGRSIGSLAQIFGQRKGKIRDFILEYTLYLEALNYNWTADERAALEDPSVKFNPPVRFLQGEGHKDQVGVELDRDKLEIKFSGPEAKEKLKHLVKKLVVSPSKGMGATAAYDAVFADYKPGTGSQPKPTTKPPSPKLQTGALFNYPVTVHSLLLKQLAKEAKTLNCEKFPAGGTFLLRNLLEAILKHIIDAQSANPNQKLLSLESAIDLALSNKVTLHPDDQKILKDFKKNHLDYINLGAHATIIPNHLRLMSARDSVDQFVKRNI